MIERVFLVNLPECHDRRKHMDRELRAQGWNDYEVHGICGRTMSEDEKDRWNRGRVAFYQEVFHRDVAPLKRGQIGCFLSHLEIYRRILDLGIECALVLEDDIHFNERFANLPDYLRQLEQVDPGWDYVYLNCVPNVWPYYEWAKDYFPDPCMDEPTLQPNVVRSGLSFGCNSQLIRRGGAEKLLAICDPILEPLDVQLHLSRSPLPKLSHLPKLRMYAFLPYPVDELTGQGSHTQSYV